MNKFLRKSIAILPLTFPVLASAAVGYGGNGQISGVFSTILGLINSYVIPLIIAIAVVYFLVGVVQYIASGGDEEKKKAGRDHMIYGVIALVVMVGVWGLVRIVGDTFQLNYGGAAPGIPGVQVGG